MLCPNHVAHQSTTRKRPVSFLSLWHLPNKLTALFIKPLSQTDSLNLPFPHWICVSPSTEDKEKQTLKYFVREFCTLESSPTFLWLFHCSLSFPKFSDMFQYQDVPILRIFCHQNTSCLELMCAIYQLQTLMIHLFVREPLSTSYVQHQLFL